MMKLIIIISVCSVLVMNCDIVRSVHLPHDDPMLITLRIIFKRSAAQDEFDEISNACKAQEKATDNDIVAWKKDIKPKSKIVKCLDACVGEKLGMLANNQLNVDAVMKFIEMENTNQKIISDLKEIVNECKSITDPDRCEMSAKVLDCINGGSRKRGMKEIF